MKSELSLLKKENKLREQYLPQEDQDMIKRMLNYMKTTKMCIFEKEVIHKELIGMALEAGQRGESLIDVLGNDEKTFCDEMVADTKKAPIKEYLLIGFRQWILYYGVIVGVTVLLNISSMHMKFDASLLVFAPLWALVCTMGGMFIETKYTYEKGIKKYIPTCVMITSLLLILFIQENIIGDMAVYLNGWVVVGVILAIGLVSQVLYNQYIHHIAKNYKWQD